MVEKTDATNSDVLNTLVELLSTGLESVRDKVDDVGSNLSARITGLELRLERLATESRTHSTGLRDLRNDLTDHKRDDDSRRVPLANAAGVSPGVPEEGGRRLFSISVDDLKGFLRVLPYLIAIGAGIAGGVYGVRGEDPNPNAGKFTVPRIAVPDVGTSKDEPEK